MDGQLVFLSLVAMGAYMGQKEAGSAQFGGSYCQNPSAKTSQD